MIDGWGISCEFALIWMTLDFTDDQSTLVQVKQQAITWANWESIAHPLTNASENLVGRVEKRPGQVEFCTGYIRDYPVQASAKIF